MIQNFKIPTVKMLNRISKIEKMYGIKCYDLTYAGAWNFIKNHPDIWAEGYNGENEDIFEEDKNE